VLDELIRNIGNVAGVLHVVPSDFVRRVRFVPETADDDDGAPRSWSVVRLNPEGALSVFIDFDRAHIHMRIFNTGATAIAGLVFAVNKNAIGLALAGAPVFPETIEAGDIAEVAVPATVNPDNTENAESARLQLAFRVNGESVFGLARLPIEIATTEAGRLSQEEFRTAFTGFEAAASKRIDEGTVADEHELSERCVYVVGRNGNKTYVSFALLGDARFVVELGHETDGFTVNAKASSPALLPIVMQNALCLFGRK